MQDDFAGPTYRVGAGLLDTLIYIVLVAGTAGIVGTLGALVVAGVVVTVLYVAMVATLGGSPGKLALGLRVTLDDGSTTPPGWRPAVMRAVPGLVAWVPVLGGLLNLALAITNIALVATDGERRSVHDRFGGTRVIRVDR